MPNLEATIFNQNLKLSYRENEKEKLINAIEVLNESWNKFSDLHGKVSDLKIITLLSLELQDSIRDYMDRLKLQKNDINLLKNEIEEKNRNFQDTSEKINKLKLEIDSKDNEISKTENVLDQINLELQQIKTNILANKDE